MQRAMRFTAHLSNSKSEWLATFIIMKTIHEVFKGTWNASKGIITHEHKCWCDLKIFVSQCFAKQSNNKITHNCHNIKASGKLQGESLASVLSSQMEV